MQLYVFGGVTGTYTGLSGGRNLGVTAGADLGFGMHYGILPQLEVRGTFPMDSGSVVGEKNVLAGLKAEKIYGRYHPYGNFLFGRGEMNYHDPGYLTTRFIYHTTNSNVWSPGAGIDIDVTRSIAFKADFQYQRYNTPVTASGTVFSKAITLGAVYRFGYRQSHPDTNY